MPISALTPRILLHSPEQPGASASAWAARCGPASPSAPGSALGSGKTTLVQGDRPGLGPADLVSSPTYVIINDYRHPEGTHLYHTDAYRSSGSALMSPC